MTKRLELKPSELRRVCNPSQFAFKDTSELASPDTVIGQERAVQAIEFGLDMRSPGYNIFVTGAEGTGKSTIVRDLTARFAKTQPVPDDWCLVNNFSDEFRPRAVALPPGRGPSFAKKISRLVNDLKKEIPKAFETEAYLKKLAAIKSRFNYRQQAIFQKIERFATERSLHIDSSQKEYPVVPVVDGKILAAEDYQKLPDDVKADIDAKVGQIQAEMEKSGRQIEKLNQQLHADIERLMNEVVLALLQKRLDPIRVDFKDRGEALGYLNALQADIVENFNLFMPAEKGEPPAAGECPQPPKAPFQKYQVNVLVHREVMKGAPVILRDQPDLLQRGRPHRETRVHGHGEHRLHPGAGGLAAQRQRRLPDHGDRAAADAPVRLGGAQTIPADQAPGHRGRARGVGLRHHLPEASADPARGQGHSARQLRSLRNASELRLQVQQDLQGPGRLRPGSGAHP